MFRLLKVLKEIKIYRDYKRILKEESDKSVFWTKNNLRIDWVGRVYTVVNLPPQIILSTDLPKEARPSFVMNEIKPINDYFKKLNLEELMTLSLEPIKGTKEESYLVVYQYLFRHLTFLWMLRFFAQIAVLIFALYKIIPYIIR